MYPVFSRALNIRLQKNTRFQTIISSSRTQLEPHLPESVGSFHKIDNQKNRFVMYFSDSCCNNNFGRWLRSRVIINRRICGWMCNKYRCSDIVATKKKKYQLIYHWILSILFFRNDKINVEWRGVKMRWNISAIDINPSDKYEITSKR